MTAIAKPVHRHPRYRAYKSSDIGWLGEVPEHWEAARADSRLSPTGTAVTHAWLSGKDVFHYSIPSVQANGDGEHQLGDHIESGKTLLRESALLISKLNPRKGTIVTAIPNEVHTVCSGEFVALAARHCEARYAEYAFRSEYVRQFLDSTVQSVTRSHQRANPADISKLWWCWPPRDEQRAIAVFLDRETARIDALIEKKRRQIELLHEKRAALISQAVTKGLDPNAPGRVSGVEWLGEIPKHWKAVRFKRCIEYITSGPRGWAEFFSDDGELFIRIGNLTRDSIDLDLSQVQHIVPPIGAEAVRTRVRAGDILVSITADLGSVAVVPTHVETAYINQHIALARPKGKVSHPRWLGYSIFSECCRNQLRALGYGGTKVQLGLEDVQNLVLCLPPREEQDKIVSWLDNEVRRQSAVVQKICDGIATLREYRTALISDAVTGKIDVRQEVA